MRSGENMKQNKMDKFTTLYRAIKKNYDQKKYEAAIAGLQQLERQAVIPEEKHWMYHQAMGLSLFWLGEIERSLEHLRMVWVEPGDMTREMQQRSYSDYLMYLHYLPNLSDEMMREEHFRYASLFTQVVPFTHEKKTKQQLRIGYISPDIVDHIVLNFAIQLFAQYDHDRYEVVLYSTGKRQNEVSGWVAGMVNAYRDLSGLSISQAARQIYEDQVDILVDLSGHAEGGLTLQIAAWKPAPVQICGIGYFDTTGLSAMDYFLGDVYCDPSASDRLFSETLIRLPHSHLCFTPSERFRDISLTYQVHTPIAFGSFNNFAKITDKMLAVWLSILQRVPGSRLILKNVSPLPEPLERMRQRARKIGYEETQLDLRPATPDYLNDYLDIDIALDTYPYPGGGTTCEAIYMGVPVINLRGTRHGSRFGYSLLSNIGIEELSTTSTEQYVERAVLLANQPDLLQALHENLRGMMQHSPVMDAKAYVREVEQAYEQVWQQWLMN